MPANPAAGDLSSYLLELSPENTALADVIRAVTELKPTDLLPEILLYQATEITPLWQATEDLLRTAEIEPPYWAFAWAGGQATARLLLDRPELVAGRRIVDFACGGGVASIAAMKAGATSVLAVDIDALAVAATRANAAANGVVVETLTADLVGGAMPECDLLMAGDVCYDARMTAHILPWLRQVAASGITVLLGDPGRAYVPSSGIELMGEYRVPTTTAIEDKAFRDTKLWRLIAA
jgi:predicted nicotinamide N-methyase